MIPRRHFSPLLREVGFLIPLKLVASCIGGNFVRVERTLLSGAFNSVFVVAVALVVDS
jgi:hypothetical protein